MSEAGPFSAAIDHAHQWLSAVCDALGDHNRERSWAVTRAVLQTLRDHLTHEEAAHFSAQLPLIFRGAFYEGWRPTETPARVRNAADFLGEIAAHLHPRHHEDLEVIVAFHAVIAAFARCGLGHELAQVQHQLPKSVQELWQTPV